jgi:small subunit ribosomal protein S16
MATAIRLKRGGRTHSPYYRVVVVDSRAKATGRVIEEVGYYQPCARPEPTTEINEESVMAWLHKGAQPSATTRNLLSKKGIMAKFATERDAKAPAEAAAAE